MIFWNMKNKTIHIIIVLCLSLIVTWCTSQESSGINNEIKECIKNYKSEFPDWSFKKWDIIITFKENVSLEDAKAILQWYKLLSDPNIIKKWTRKVVPQTLLIQIPIKEELKRKCILEKNENIEYVELNRTISID